MHLDALLVEFQCAGKTTCSLLRFSIQLDLVSFECTAEREKEADCTENFHTSPTVFIM
jgi:hypothetical protein